MVKVSTETGLLAAFGLYIYVYFDFKNVVVAYATAAAVGLYTKSTHAAIGALLAAILLHGLTVVLTPQTTSAYQRGAGAPSNLNYSAPSVEGFQPKDPLSVHQRIAAQKLPGPLSPKVDMVTGVLESPEILDALQVAQLNGAEVGGSPKTLPSGMVASEPIRTPAEGSIPREPTPDSPPLANPVLQNGPDQEGVLTALIQKGTALFKGQPSAEVAAVPTGSASGYT